MFHGLIGKKSCSGLGDPYLVCYSDQRNSFSFKRFVTATDQRDGKVKISVDTSKIRWSKSGDYRIYYTAKDSDNNQSKAWATVRVIVPGSAESAADQVLRSITKSGWSDEKKARAIYRYVRGTRCREDSGISGT